MPDNEPNWKEGEMGWNQELEEFWQTIPAESEGPVKLPLLGAIVFFKRWGFWPIWFFKVTGCEPKYGFRDQSDIKIPYAWVREAVNVVKQNREVNSPQQIDFVVVAVKGQK